MNAELIPKRARPTPMQTLKELPLIRLEKNYEMPSVPVVLTRILQLVDDNRASAQRLEKLILHDPPLTARILKLANSAFFSFRYEVKTISHAITLLGLNLVKSLAIGVSVFESFSKGLREEIAFISQLWMHSIGVGMMSQEIWLKRGNRTESEFALLCGLLHDLGKILYFKKDAVGYGRQFGRKKGDQDPDISALELECYGVDHATLGALIAKQWRLPPELATVVQHHHSSFTQSQLVAAVSVADMLAKQTGIGYDGDRKIREDLADMQAMLQMNSQEYDRLVEMAESKRVEVEAFFQLNP